MEKSGFEEVVCVHWTLLGNRDDEMLECKECGMLALASDFYDKVVPNGKKLVKLYPKTVLQEEKTGFGFKLESKSGNVKPKTNNRRKRKHGRGQKGLLS